MGRPSAPLLNPECITEAALELVAMEGDFSFPKLAKKLGVSQSSIYHHVAGRAELIELLRGATFVPPSETSEANWPDKLRALIRRYRDGFARHPRLAPLLATSTVENPAILGLYENIAAALVEGGLGGGDLISAIGLVDSFAMGAALDLAAPEVPWKPHQDGFPVLEEALAQAPPSLERSEAAFEFGLETLILGLQSRLGVDKGQRNSLPGHENPTAL